MKVVYNVRYGGFSLSEAGVRLGRQISGNPLWGGPCLVGDRYENGELSTRFYGGARDIDRTDKVLVSVVEVLGKLANGEFAELRIADVPSGVRWRIDEYEGLESVMTVDDYDWRVAE